MNSPPPKSATAAFSTKRPASSSPSETAQSKSDKRRSLNSSSTHNISTRFQSSSVKSNSSSGATTNTNLSPDPVAPPFAEASSNSIVPNPFRSTAAASDSTPFGSPSNSIVPSPFRSTAAASASTPSGSPSNSIVPSPFRSTAAASASNPFGPPSNRRTPSKIRFGTSKHVLPSRLPPTTPSRSTRPTSSPSPSLQCRSLEARLAAPPSTIELFVSSHQEKEVPADFFNDKDTTSTHQKFLANILSSTHTVVLTDGTRLSLQFTPTDSLSDFLKELQHHQKQGRFRIPMFLKQAFQCVYIVRNKLQHETGINKYQDVLELPFINQNKWDAILGFPKNLQEWNLIPQLVLEHWIVDKQTEHPEFAVVDTATEGR